MIYQHGGDIYRNQVVLDYSTNLSPLGMPEAVKKAAVRSVSCCACYPDSQCQELVENLSDFHQIPKEFIICGNGAADLIFQLAWAKKPKKALLISPSFLEYEQALHTIDCEISYFCLKEETGFTPDISGIINMLQSEGPFDLLFFCNPNNPTGTALPAAGLLKLADYCKKNKVLFAVDECFNEFMEEGAAYSLLGQAGKNSCLFLLRAFTKIYAMAGLRLGYGICADIELLEAMRRSRQPWSVSVPAQKAGIAALKEGDYVKNVRLLIKRERSFLKEKLSSMGYAVYGSEANYIFFCDRKQGGDQTGKPYLFDALKEKGILIRSCANYRGLDPSFYRICIRTREQNSRLLAAIEEADGKRGGLKWQNR